jgi:large subunit ribosomal protein L41
MNFLALQRSSLISSLTSFPLRSYTKGGSFKKRLGLYSYKHKRRRLFKNPHAVKLATRQKLKQEGHKGRLRIRDLERNADRPFGQFTRKGGFLFNIEMVPFYNIPDLTGFTLKPYVAHKTGMIPDEDFEEKKVTLTEADLEEILSKIRENPDTSMPAKIDPLSELKK